MPILIAARCQTVLLALDADAWENEHVGRALHECHKAIVAAGIDVEVERWEPSAGKGIDDVLLGGGAIEILTGEAAARAVADALPRGDERAQSHTDGHGPQRNGKSSPEGPGPAAAGEDEEEDEIIDRWPRIAPEAYHGIAGEFVRAVDPHTEGDPVGVLVQFLVMMGNVLGRQAYYRVGGDLHYLNEFVALVGRTATGRKGSSCSPVKMAGQSLDGEWAKTRIGSGMVSGEGLIYHVRDATYKLVDLKERGQVIGQEKVLEDGGEPDKRLLVVETEMGRVLKAINRETNTLSDVIRLAWDSGMLRTMAKNSGNRATEAHVSLICHVTDSDIRKHLLASESLNGFGNRFLWVLVRRSKSLPDGGDLEGPEFEWAWEPVQHGLRAVKEFALTVGRMRRDPAAAKLWREIYETLSANKPGILGALLSRAEAHVTRLACIYAILEQSTTVRVEHLNAALAVWNYAEASTRVIFADRTEDNGEGKLLAALRASPDGLSRTQITAEVFGRNKSRLQIAALLSDLLTQGEIHKAPLGESTGPGRRPQLWRIGREPRTCGN
jgi:hypothetical protein